MLRSDGLCYAAHHAHFDVVVLLDDVLVNSVRGRPQPLVWQLVRVLDCLERVVLLGVVCFGVQAFIGREKGGKIEKKKWRY